MSRVVVVSGDKRMTAFMQNSGVFESFKVIAGIQEITIANDLSRCDAESLAKAVNAIRKAGDETDVPVYAIGFPGDNGGRWIAPGIKVISNGQKWGMLDKVLTSLGISEKELACWTQPATFPPVT